MTKSGRGPGLLAIIVTDKEEETKMAGYGNKHDGMKVVEITWDTVDKGGPKPPDTGFYVVEVGKAEAKPTKETRLPMVALQLKATQRIAPSGDAEEAKGTIYDNLVFSQEAAWKAKQFCEAAGIRPPNMKKIAGKNGEELFTDWANDCINATMFVEVRTAKDVTTGKMRANIQRYLTQEELHEALQEGQSLADGEEEEEEERPRRTAKKNGKAAAAVAAAEAEDDDGDEEEEEVPQRRMPRRQVAQA